MEQSDAQILKHYLEVGKRNTTNAKEKAEIQAHLDLLDFDQSPETIDLCNRYRQSIHDLIIGKIQLTLPFEK